MRTARYVFGAAMVAVLLAAGEAYPRGLSGVRIYRGPSLGARVRGPAAPVFTMRAPIAPIRPRVAAAGPVVAPRIPLGPAVGLPARRAAAAAAVANVARGRAFATGLALGQAQVASIRLNVNQQLQARGGYQPFVPAWYESHPGAWRPATQGQRSWAAASWENVRQHASLDDSAVDYDYRTDANGLLHVFRDGQRQSLAVRSRPEAARIANADVPVSDQTEWLPLGVYVLIPPNVPQAQLMLQLSVSKEGAIRGTVYDSGNDLTRQLQGSVDKAAKRVAWSITDQATTTLMETGLGNLTQDATRLLVHLSDGWTQMWTLVRMADEASKQPETKQPAGQEPPEGQK